jgi:(p)ppGpp synthase/HD superfamily hydrolase
MDVLDKITDFADRAHGAQMRKYEPERYIVHPIRVMKICSEYTTDVQLLAAALLHDVIEDTTTTADDIHLFLLTVMNPADAAATTALVVELTDVYVKKDYPQWNRRTRKAREADRLEQTSPASQTVKYADIIDNCVEIARHDEDDFSEKFLKECRSLLKRINKGDQRLYQRAVVTVDECIVSLAARKM